MSRQVGDSARAVWFTGKGRAEIRNATVREPLASEVLVRASVSLISAGTETLVYRGEASPDDLLPAGSEGSFTFPIKYGYQCVGRVERAGAESGLRVGDRVFARHPHQDLFTLDARDPAALVPIPDSVTDDVAAFFNLTKVALTALLEVPVRVGDVAVIFGQGVIGLLLTQLVRRTAGHLIVVDPIERRRALGLKYGADAAVPPADVRQAVEDISRQRWADVCFEASGVPAALQSAIDVTGETGAIVVVSYFGARAASLRLAPEFHFRRQHIVSTQAAVIPPLIAPRWDLARRARVVWSLLEELPIADLITARLPLEHAARAYDLVDKHSDEMIGVLLDHGAAVRSPAGPR